MNYAFLSRAAAVMLAAGASCASIPAQAQIPGLQLRGGADHHRRKRSAVHAARAHAPRFDAAFDLFAPPIALEAVAIRAYWHPRHQEDAGHRWLREQLFSAAGTVARG